MSGFNKEQVLGVRHWTDTLFSFTTTRDRGFRFRSGQFTMMGLEVQVILVHGCRQVSELAYGEELVDGLRRDDLFSEIIGDKLEYYPTVTREPFRNRGRITDLIATDKLFADIGMPPLEIETDRVMMCGSPSMLADLRNLMSERGFQEGSHGEPGHFVVEKAFVER